MKESEDSGKMFSVIICTYNRCDLLVNALQALSGQTLEKSNYEVIVVDNNSQDNTRDITEGFSLKFPNIRYCLETQQGLSYARNRGWRQSNGTYVAYIDDECKVPTKWLAVAKQIIECQSPAVFGGPYYGYHNSSMPCWWKKSYESFELSETARNLRPEENLRGANIFIQRNLLEMTGGFSIELGMSGEVLAYGEEADLQKRIRTTMPNVLIYYDPDLYIYHLVRSEKVTWRYILCSRFAGGRHIYTVFCDDIPEVSGLYKIGLLLKAILTIFIFFASFLIGVLRLDRKRYPYLQNYLYENTFMHVQTFGLIYERILHST